MNADAKTSSTETCCSLAISTAFCYNSSGTLTLTLIGLLSTSKQMACDLVEHHLNRRQSALRRALERLPLSLADCSRLPRQIPDARLRICPRFRASGV